MPYYKAFIVQESKLGEKTKENKLGKFPCD